MNPLARLLYPTLLAGSLLLNGCKKEYTPTSPAPISQSQAIPIPDGNLDQDLPGWYNGFDNDHLTNPNNYRFALDTEAYSSPKHALNISCAQVNNDSAYAFFAQGNLPFSAIPVKAKLTLKAKIKTALIGQGAAIALRGNKGRSEVFFVTTQGKITIAGNQDFTEYSVALNSFPGGIDNLTVYLLYLPKTTGKVYFDDISMMAN